MELNIPKTNTTPAIRFDPATSVLTIAGESYPENSFDFYAPVLEWLAENLPALPGFRLDITVSYMNSSSIKCMLDILDAIGDAHAAGKNVEVVWYYETDNPRALDLAEEFREEVTFPFTVTAIGG
ncbi:MAG TPA: SiaC family regulatory phosphoprotein [Spirochaetia bacterium]